MQVTAYDAPFKEGLDPCREWMPEAYRQIVDAGILEQGDWQKVDLALVEKIMERIRQTTPWPLVITPEEALVDLHPFLCPSGSAMMYTKSLFRLDILEGGKRWEKDLASKWLADPQCNPLDRAMAPFLLGHLPEALRAFSKLIESGSYGLLPHLHHAHVLERMGDNAGALQDYERCLTSPRLPSRADVLVDRARILFVMGRIAEVIQALNEAVASLVANPDQSGFYWEEADTASAEDIWMEFGIPPPDPECEEANRRETVRKSLLPIVEATKTLDVLGMVPPNQQAGLEAVKAAIMGLREQYGF